MSYTSERCAAEQKEQIRQKKIEIVARVLCKINGEAPDFLIYSKKYNSNSAAYQFEALPQWKWKYSRAATAIIDELENNN